MKTLQHLHFDMILIELLKKQSDTPFTNTEIRDLYLSRIPQEHQPDRNQLRKYIYKELLRLESAKVIERYEGSVGRGCKFIFRSEQREIQLNLKSSPFWKADEDPFSLMDLETQKALQNELSQRKVELIASIGEAEEYHRLYEKYPALRSSVKTQYLQSRDRSTKLLGQLRAVESIIAKIGFPS